MIQIVQKGDAVLRHIAEVVPVADIGSKKVQDIIARMKKAIAQEEDAVAIAAPQIGEAFRIFVVSGKIFMENYPDINPEDAMPADLVAINPEITKLSKEKKKVPEGCLSVRWLYGDVSRSTRASIKAYDEHGKEYKRGGSGLLAQIFQHEIDHLNGILFIDKAENIEDIPPEKIKEQTKL
ncbi:peptide deformylase [Candidatus Parcubacteria bacterium]|nr:peptide deformylase [Candidatus Parcubacteria bacterium]